MRPVLHSARAREKNTDFCGRVIDETGSCVYCFESEISAMPPWIESSPGTRFWENCTGMNVINTEIEGIRVLEPRVFGDARGYFFEVWNEAEFKQAGIDVRFIQDNESKSRFGVLRGLHYQLPPYTQAKLVRVVQGAVLDICLDIRRGSPTFGKHYAIELSGNNKRQVFIPRGFAHGFVVLSPDVIFAYKCDNAYMPSHERGIAFDDPELKINWGIKPASMLLSEKDRRNPLLKDAELLVYEGPEASS